MELRNLEGQGLCGCGALIEARTLLTGPEASSSTDTRCLTALDCSCTTEYSNER